MKSTDTNLSWVYIQRMILLLRKRHAGGKSDQLDMTVAESQQFHQWDIFFLSICSSIRLEMLSFCKVGSLANLQEDLERVDSLPA